MTLSLLHEDGRPIAAEEASARDYYVRFAEEHEDSSVSTNLGRLLRDILDGGAPDAAGSDER